MCRRGFADRAHVDGIFVEQDAENRLPLFPIML